MPIISTIGRRAFKVRILVWSIYAVLTVGSLSMIYPFLLMVSGSTKSPVDTQNSVVIPRFLLSDKDLYRKHIEGLFNESGGAMQNSYGLFDAVFARIEPPTAASPLVEDWREFVKRIDNSSWFILGYLQCQASGNVTPFNLDLLRKELLAETGGIPAFNLRFETSFPSPRAIFVTVPNFINRFVDYPHTEFLRRVDSFSLSQPPKWRCAISLANSYRGYLQIRHGKSIADFNTVFGTTYASWADVEVGETAPDTVARDDYESFLREIVNPTFVRISPDAAPEYHRYLTLKYSADIAAFNLRSGNAFASFEEIPLLESMPRSGIEKSDWKGFLEGWRDPSTGELIVAPLTALHLTGPDFGFREFLRAKYGSLDEMNARLSTHFASWEVVSMPQRESQFGEFQEMKPQLRWMFSVRNYVDVWSFLVINGRGMINTIIFCVLAVLAALTVNPIAAYALSRFKPKSTYAILLFFMMTMAFPGMVSQIPTFLMLRDLGMLNTFWALILPGVANGFGIFLLKGFFDSLPRELYESAEIDGAGELTVFFSITLALSKPILAVMALGAFTGAYTAFMFALLICQDPKMWTLMVWLFQLQQNSSQGIVFASLIIAAIPTLLIFIFCQNMIMRGIIVPVEK